MDIATIRSIRAVVSQLNQELVVLNLYFAVNIARTSAKTQCFSCKLKI